MAKHYPCSIFDKGELKKMRDGKEVLEVIPVFKYLNKNLAHFDQKYIYKEHLCEQAGLGHLLIRYFEGFKHYIIGNEVKSKIVF